MGILAPWRTWSLANLDPFQDMHYAEFAEDEVRFV